MNNSDSFFRIVKTKLNWQSSSSDVTLEKEVIPAPDKTLDCPLGSFPGSAVNHDVIFVAVIKPYQI